MRQMLLENLPILVPILALSILALALIVERLIVYARFPRMRRQDLEQVLELVQRRKTREALALAADKPMPSAHVVRAGLELRGNTLAEVRVRIQAAMTREMNRLERNVSYLAGIANVATLLGLFGTVTGMIASFFAMKSAGISSPEVLAGGISQALFTTAAGLAVAIPSLFAHNLFTQVVSRHAEEMETVASELLAYYAGRRTTPGRAHG
jgi:biopolymer transport protein ExbB